MLLSFQILKINSLIGAKWLKVLINQKDNMTFSRIPQEKSLSSFNTVTAALKIRVWFMTAAIRLCCTEAVLDAINEEARKPLRAVSEVLMVELDNDDVAREYRVPVRNVKSLEALMK